MIGRIDACGRPMWARSGRFHHSVEADDSGGLWSWRDEAMVRLDARTGDVTREIDLRDVIADGGRYGELAIHATEDADEVRYPGDAFHPNDVEPLRAGMAGAFPMFAAGDLLVSLRELNLVAVLDPAAAPEMVSSRPLAPPARPRLRAGRHHQRLRQPDGARRLPHPEGRSRDRRRHGRLPRQRRASLLQLPPRQAPVPGERQRARDRVGGRARLRGGAGRIAGLGARPRLGRRAQPYRDERRAPAVRFLRARRARPAAPASAPRSTGPARTRAAHPAGSGILPSI